MHGCRPRRALQKRAAFAKLGASNDGKACRTLLKRGIGKTPENISHYLFFAVKRTSLLSGRAGHPIIP